MANVITSQLYDGARNVVLHRVNASDGTAEALVKIVDVTTLVPNPGTSLRVVRIEHNIQGGTVQLFWEQTANSLLADLAGYNDLKWVKGPGLINPKGAGSTGSILLSTNAFAAGSAYDITIYMRKN